MSSQKGFTVVELLIATSLAAAVSILMFSMTIYLYGDQLKLSARSDMTLESQLFLRRLVDDIRVAGEVRASNQIPDSNSPGAGWITSDPANILVLTFPAVDETGSFISDPSTGQIYQNEIVYFGENGTMYRRTLANPSAVGNVAQTTCPQALASSTCPPDIKLSDNLQNMQFNFFDINDNSTTVIADTRAVQLTVNLGRVVYGDAVNVSLSTKATMRNAGN